MVIKNFFSKLKIDFRNDGNWKKTEEDLSLFFIKNGEELTKLYLKSDVILLTCVFVRFINVSFNYFELKLLYCVSLPGFTRLCGLKYTGINSQTASR